MGPTHSMILLSMPLGLLACVLLLPMLSDLVSLVRILFHGSPEQSPGVTELPRLLVLVPAHNEEMMVAACVRSLLRMRYPAERYTVTVVADNCDDRTAETARAAGAHCLERADPLRPGKPHAIVWALERLPVDGYDATIILDADTVVAPDFAAALARAAPLDAKAVQAYFDVDNHTETALTRLATVQAAANHRFAYPLKRRAGLNTPLVGNGMCIGTAVLKTHGWRAFSIAEDWEMYAQLTARGVPIECAPDAVLYAQEAHTLRQSLSQRERWTAGRLTVLARCGLPLVRSGRLGFRQKLDAVAELSYPGPALHLGVALLGIGLVLLLRLPPAIGLLLLASLLRPLAYAVLALRAQPDPARTVMAFAFLPVYALWRVGAAASALRMLGDKPWIRTPRHRHRS
jgi:cellulose synthase/poly-beta-1,6-N-acetylglucosamine synthase-like glycosyltransferase